MLTSIAGKNVLVTGASGGIGRGIAQIFAAQRANVLVVARGLEGLDETVTLVSAAGGTASAFQGDVTSATDMANAAQAVVDRYGSLDIVCSNAGIFPFATLSNMSAEQWNEVLDINLGGCFTTVKACLPHLLTAGWGRIILTSSITGPITGAEGWSHYGASKAGQLGFMRSIALELATKNITINAVMPGNIVIEKMTEEEIRTMEPSIPKGKLGRESTSPMRHCFLHPRRPLTSLARRWS